MIGILKPVPESQWPVRCHDPKRSNVWANSYFLVQEFQEDDGVIRLTVNTTSIGSSGRWKDGISWGCVAGDKVSRWLWGSGCRGDLPAGF